VLEVSVEDEAAAFFAASPYPVDRGPLLLAEFADSARTTRTITVTDTSAGVTVSAATRLVNITVSDPQSNGFGYSGVVKVGVGGANWGRARQSSERTRSAQVEYYGANGITVVFRTLDLLRVGPGPVAVQDPPELSAFTPFALDAA
jgi:hypothetical protein